MNSKRTLYDLSETRKDLVIQNKNFEIDNDEVWPTEKDEE